MLNHDFSFPSLLLLLFIYSTRRIILPFSAFVYLHIHSLINLKDECRLFILPSPTLSSLINLMKRFLNGAAPQAARVTAPWTHGCLFSELPYSTAICSDSHVVPDWPMGGPFRWLPSPFYLFKWRDTVKNNWHLLFKNTSNKGPRQAGLMWIEGGYRNSQLDVGHALGFLLPS